MAHAKGDALQEDIQSQMYDMRNQGTFCDAYITIPDENVKLNVHRNIMACCSHYFRSLFTLGWKEANQDEITIQNISAATMEEIIRFAYLRQARICADNVEDLLAAADRFHMFGLLKECAEFLHEQLSPENCIGIRKFFKFYNCLNFAEKAWKFILMNFKTIEENSQEFLQLELDELLEIVSSDRLTVADESNVFKAIQRWVGYDYRKRKVHYPSLLKRIRFKYMNRDFFVNTVLRSEVKKISSCSQILAAAKEIVNSDEAEDDGDIYYYLADYLPPRVPLHVIFTVGGWSSGGVVNTLETYDLNVNRWFESCPVMDSSRAYHGTVQMDGLIYIIGGFDGTRYLNSVMTFCPTRKLWEERAPMYMSRCYVSSVTLSGTIYSCGGFDGRQRHCSAERYDPTRNQWTVIQSMHRQRSDAGSTTLDDKIYIAGGFDGHTCLDSIEMYDTKTDQWTLLPSMMSRRSGVVLVTLNRDVIALGGYDGTRRLETVEVYNARTKSWTYLPSMRLGRSNCAAVVMNEEIVVIGGYDGETTSPQVESYNSTKKKWHTLRPLNVGRSAVSACVLSDLENASDFTFHGAIHFDDDDDSDDSDDES
ncbi:hypothetical protein FSP39_010001 [Pinctada imbricata]|uniref:BTB domain-containing protein n=1 Tax=Pinctada imbricata TaxID=66713 RepID=A0AA88YTQ5_PINIB|nr:hypothetical protein FSP39_010001 [Pinctada imbricata]